MLQGLWRPSPLPALLKGSSRLTSSHNSGPCRRGLQDLEGPLEPGPRFLGPLPSSGPSPAEVHCQGILKREIEIKLGWAPDLDLGCG